ncbi:MAG: glutamate--tRNA ligase family protein [Planctomycetota bacterium]|nr:glutamate--tRNA ligase family protein [Planctomycetota bacterium]
MPTTRLAPSPTGALHLGNARTFLITWALARAAGWSIVLRVEDLDTPRVKPGVIAGTIDLLAWLGIDWDSGPFIQSADTPRHLDAMHRLARAGLVYPCDLTRAQIEAAASAPQEGAHDVPFPRHLRPASFPSTFTDDAPSWRFAVEPGATAYTDLFAGPQAFDIASIVGDFVVWTRRDPARPGQASYQLAVVTDDHAQGVTHVVRGDDLLDSGARQLRLARALGLTPEPAYLHLPLVRGQDGRRLAKRHGDTRLDLYRASGVPPERVVGLVAYWSGVRTARTPMSAREFQAALRLDTIPRTPVIFTPEDDAWLVSR